MNLRFAAVASIAALLGAVAPAALAVPASVELNGLRAIQTYHLEDKGDDQVYLLVSGVASGQPISQKLPKDAWTAGPKKMPVNKDEPLTLWKGDLAEGEFAAVTVTLMHGAGKDDAKTKEFLDKKAAAEKKIEALGKKTLTADEIKKLPGALLAAHQELITKVKEIYAREKNTDHYGGQFTVVIWNDGGKIKKRLDPVGLTFGEHAGTGVKAYTKLKWTLTNVMEKADDGEWALVQMVPISDDEKTLRIKMLETEIVKTPERPIRNVTDYLLEVQVTGAGKAQTWELEGENAGKSDLHTYWDYAK